MLFEMFEFYSRKVANAIQLVREVDFWEVSHDMRRASEKSLVDTVYYWRGQLHYVLNRHDDYLTDLEEQRQERIGNMGEIL